MVYKNLGFLIMIVVTSHYNEDLYWLEDSKYPVVVIDKEGAAPTCLSIKTIIPNRGREASSFLRYIIDHYDNLPSHVAFIHGHETAWHQKRPFRMIDMINNVLLKDDMFVSFNGTYEVCKIEQHSSDTIQINKNWDIIKPWVGPIPGENGMTDAGAQFIVSRNRIRQHPKKAYQSWYDALMSQGGQKKSTIICTDSSAKCTIDYELSVFFEYTWHYIFGEPWVMEPKPFPNYRLLSGETLPSKSFVETKHIFIQEKERLSEALKNVMS